jgi:hypothetical protein
LRPPLYALLMPELEPAFGRLQTTGDWELLEQARMEVLTRLRRVAGDVQDLLDDPQATSTEWLRAEIQPRYLAPLGL